jgi:predicted aspartyl protease
MRGVWLALLGVAWSVVLQGVVSATNHRSTLRFKLYGGYTIVVRGSAGRLRNLNVIVDTGAVPSVVDQRIADKLGLVGDAEPLSIFKSTLQAQRVMLPSVILGPIQTGPLPALAEDLSPFSKALGTPIDGMIGLDVLSRSDFTLDYVSKQIIFGQVEPSDSPRAVPIEVNADYVTVQASIQDRPVRLMVDTGTMDLILFGSRVRDRALGMRLLSQKSVTNLGGRFEVVRAELPEASLGPVSLRRRHVSIMEVSKDAPPNLDGLLGVRFLGVTRLGFDFEHKVMIWESSDRGEVNREGRAGQ